MSRKNVTSLKLSKIQGRWALFPETKSCPVLIRLCHIIDGKFVSEKTRGSPVTIFKEMTSKKRKHKRWNTFKLLKYSTAWLSKSSGCWRSTVRLVRLKFSDKNRISAMKKPWEKTTRSNHSCDDKILHEFGQTLWNWNIWSRFTHFFVLCLRGGKKESSITHRSCLTLNSESGNT